MYAYLYINICACQYVCADVARSSILMMPDADATQDCTGPLGQHFDSVQLT